VEEEGTVTGIVAQRPDGPVTIFGEKGVLLDTGGFEWDEDLTAFHFPGPLLHPQTPPGNEGDGQRMAAQAGAALALMDQTIGMPAICVSGEDNDGRQLYRILFQDLALPHAIVVNEQGKRFANETFFVDIAKAWAVTGPTGKFVNLPCYLVFDQSYVKRYGFPGGVTEGLELAVAPSLSDLAKELGIDPGGLEHEVATYNRAISHGEPDPFARGSSPYQQAFGDHTVSGNPTVGPLLRPPFHGIRIHPATSGHRGGVVIGKSGHVLTGARKVIPGLFACGACAAGTLTGATYFTGTAVGHALVFAAAAVDAMAVG
jgi:succinate dehydrogenase/fumarate reductase flavoprotein subunit